MAKKKKPKQTKREKKIEDSTGVFVPAGLLLGMGIGFAVGNLVAWLFIGLGAGFLAMAIANMILWKKRK
jgi:hypothetical protein